MLESCGCYCPNWPNNLNLVLGELFSSKISNSKHPDETYQEKTCTIQIIAIPLKEERKNLKAVLALI